MFYSENILSKKGALGKVWLAAHWEKKLSKTMLLQTNILSSVGAIMGGDQPPMALRLSGQLLLGVVRIYSKKAKYLLDDCNDALSKIKMAFRPGVVDLPNEQTAVSFNAITLADTITEFDILLPEPAFNLQKWSDHLELNMSQHISRPEDITLADHASTSILDHTHENLFDNADINDQLEWQLDLGQGLDDYAAITTATTPSKKQKLENSSLEIEVGRDAVPEQSFSPLGNHSILMDTEKNRSNVDIDKDVTFELPSHHDPAYPDDLLGGGEMEIDFSNDIAPQSFSLDLGRQAIPSPFSKDFGGDDFQIQATLPSKKTHQSLRKRKLIVDESIEIPSKNIMSQLKDTSDIMKPLPLASKSRLLMDLELSLAKGGNVFLKYPMYDNLDSILEVFFEKVEETTRNIKPNEKKMDMFELNPSLPQSPIQYGEVTVDESFSMAFEPPVYDEVLPEENNIYESMDQLENVDINMSTIISPSKQLQQSNAVNDKEDLFVFEEEETTENGFSQASIKTMKLFQNKLLEGPIHQSSNSPLSFNSFVQKTSRSDTVKLFFELLVLSTKNVIQVKQEESFGDISIYPKNKFYDSLPMIPLR